MSESRDLAERIEAARPSRAGAIGLASLTAELTSSTRQPHGSQPDGVLRPETVQLYRALNQKSNKKIAKSGHRKGSAKRGSLKATAWSGRRVDKIEAPAPQRVVPHVVPHVVPSGVDEGWAALGREVGFLPVWNAIAVVEYRTPTYVGALGKLDGAPRKAAKLRELLAAKDIDDFTLVVAIPKLTAAEIDLVCEQDAYVIKVPEAFWTQDAAARISTCRGLIAQPQGVDHLLPGITADEMKVRDRVAGEYSGRNPDLDEADAEEWRHRVFQTAQVA